MKFNLYTITYVKDGVETKLSGVCAKSHAEAATKMYKPNRNVLKRRIEKGGDITEYYKIKCGYEDNANSYYYALW